MKKNKIASLAVAGALTVTALLAGTYAWTSISQQALNEATGEVNPGARLHDDFNGTNKDIYVENFTTEEEDGAIIYARIKLDEYLSFGENAGTTDGDNDAIPSDGKSPGLADPSTWSTYKLGEATDFRYYFDLLWGDEEAVGVPYMPTFNKNKDSLEADINGTFAGKDGDRAKGDAYDDCLKYVEDADAYDPDTYTPGTPIGEMTNVEIYDIDGDTVNEDEYLNASIIDKLTNGKGTINTVSVDDSIDLTNENDGSTVTATVTKVEPENADANTPITAVELNLDPNATENDGADIRVVASQVHTVATTAVTEKVITMDQWKALGCPIGAYWVYDKDGWAYWAQGIGPGETTGCLLTGISRSGTISMKYYYAINVTAEFATAGDWGEGTANEKNENGKGFYINGISDDGLMLLNTIAGNEKKLIVTSTADAMRPGESITLDAKVMLGATKITSDTVKWSIDVADDVASIVSTSATTAQLTVKESATVQGITVKAKIKGTSVEEEKAISIKDVYIVTVEPTEEVEYLVPENEDTLTFTASVTSRRENAPAYTGIIWEIEGNTSDDTKIEKDTSNPYEATLTLGKYEEADTITVKAICEADTVYYDEYQVTVYTQLEYLDEISKDSTKWGLVDTHIKIDGINWYILNRADVDADNEEEVLLWASRGVTGWGGPASENYTYDWPYWSAGFAFNQDTADGEDSDKTTDTAKANWWRYSNARAWLNDSTQSDVTVNETKYGQSTSTETTGNKGFLVDKEILSANAQKVDILTKHEYNDSNTDETNYEKTEDQIFLLTQADIFGHTSNPGTVNDPAVRGYDYTVPGMDSGKLLKDVYAEDETTEINSDLMRRSRDLDNDQTLREWSWLRSPRAYANGVAGIDDTSAVSSCDYTVAYGRLRPALWMNLTSSSVTE